MSLFWKENDIVFMGFEMENFILVLKYKLFLKDRGVIITFGC